MSFLTESLSKSVNVGGEWSKLIPWFKFKKKNKVRVWRPYWQISKQTSLACTFPPAVHLPPPIIVHRCWSLTSNQDTVQASGSLSRWLGFSTSQFCWFSSLCLVELRDLYLKTRWWRQCLWGLRKNIRNDIKIVASFLFKVQVRSLKSNCCKVKLLCCALCYFAAGAKQAIFKAWGGWGWPTRRGSAQKGYLF